MILKFLLTLSAAALSLLWLSLSISPSKTKSEARHDPLDYELVKKVRKKAAGRSLNEYYCVYISQEGKTKAIRVTENECEEEI